MLPPLERSTSMSVVLENMYNVHTCQNRFIGRKFHFVLPPTGSKLQRALGTPVRVHGGGQHFPRSARKASGEDVFFTQRAKVHAHANLLVGNGLGQRYSG